MMTREEKLEKLNKMAHKPSKTPTWQKVAQWDEDHEDALEDYATIAFRIIKHMEKQNLKRKDLAASLGVTSQALGRILKGRQNLSLQTIRKMEKVLGLILIDVLKENPKLSYSKIG